MATRLWALILCPMVLAPSQPILTDYANLIMFINYAACTFNYHGGAWSNPDCIYQIGFWCMVQLHHGAWCRPTTGSLPLSIVHLSNHNNQPETVHHSDHSRCGRYLRHRRRLEAFQPQRLRPFCAFYASLIVSNANPDRTRSVSNGWVGGQATAKAKSS